jgi:hypothetical protein
VAAVKNVGFHPRQVLHPCQDVGELEERLVPTPDHQGGRLPTLEILGDAVEPHDVARIIGDERSLLVPSPGHLQR